MRPRKRGGKGNFKQLAKHTSGETLSAAALVKNWGDEQELGDNRENWKLREGKSLGKHLHY